MKNNQKHILFTDDIERSKAEIVKAGGRVTQIFEESILVANLPEQFDIAAGLKYSSTTPLLPLDEKCEMILEALNNPIPIDKNGLESIRSIRSRAATKIEYKADTDLAMTGDIGLGVIFVSGPADIPSLYIPPETKQKVIQQLGEGAGSFIDTADRYRIHLSLSFVTDSVEIDIPPTQHCTGTGVNVCVETIMNATYKALGVSEGEYLQNLKNRLGTGEKTFILVATNYNFADFLVGVHWVGHNTILVSLSETFLHDLGLTYIHELCHCFGAKDEYFSSYGGKSCKGDKNTPNNNAFECFHSYSKVPCIMNADDTFEPCPWTMGQIGWIQTEAMGNPACMQSTNGSSIFHFLHIAYRNTSNNISHISFLEDDGPWMYRDVNILTSAEKASSDPCVIAIGSSAYHIVYADIFDGVISLYWDGSQFHTLYLSAFAQLVDIKARNPSACVSGNNLIVAFRDSLGDIYTITWDGSQATAQNLTKDTGATKALDKPCINAYGEINLEIGYCDIYGDICYLYYEPFGRWTFENLSLKTGASKASGGPRITTYVEDYLNYSHLVYADDDGCIVTIIWNGTEWQYQNLSKTVEGEIPLALGHPDILTFEYNSPFKSTLFYIVYTDIYTKISGFFYNGSDWRYINLSNAAGENTPLAGSDPNISRLGTLGIQVVYRSVDNDIASIYYQGQEIASWNSRIFYVTEQVPKKIQSMAG